MHCPGAFSLVTPCVVSSRGMHFVLLLVRSRPCVVYTLSTEVCVCAHTMHHTVPKGDDEIFGIFGCVSTFFRCSKLLTNVIAHFCRTTIVY
jgi:hypothetical protein